MPLPAGAPRGVLAAPPSAPPHPRPRPRPRPTPHHRRRQVTELNFRQCPPLPIPYELREGPGRCYGDRWFQARPP